MAGTIVNNELATMWKDTVVPYLWYYSGICVEKLRKPLNSPSVYPVSESRHLSWISRIWNKNATHSTVKFDGLSDTVAICLNDIVSTP
jgi:hypothetical protein